MPSLVPTKHTLDLANEITKRGIKVELEHWDKHKHVDIFLPENGMYIEIEGLQHFTSPRQIISDLKRDFYSDKENHFTFRITNQLIETHLQVIADAILEVVRSTDI